MSTLRLPEAVRKFAQKRHTAVFSVVEQSGRPHAATVSYVVDDALRFYFVSRPDSRKVVALESNPYACLTIYDDRNLSKSAQVCGIARVISEESLVDRMLRRIISRLWKEPQGIPTVYKIPGDGLVLVEVSAQEVRWLSGEDQTSPMTLRKLIVAN